MTGRTKLAIAVVCTAGGVLGFVGRALYSSPTKLAIYPSQVVFSQPRFQGEPLEAHFELKNESSDPITVTSLSSSCGCMALSGAHGELVSPFTIEPWETCPATLNVATGNRVGVQTFRLSVSARTPRARELSAHASVQVTLQAGLRAEPNAVIFRRVKPDSAVSAEVKLADALPDPGVTIREIKTSNPEAMRVEIVPETGPSPLYGENTDAHARGTLKLTYTPMATEGRLQEMITIVPDNSRYPTLQIPVYCEMDDGPFKFSPSGLTISPGATEQFSRTVVFQSQDPATSLQCMKTPQGVQVELGDAKSGVRTISIRGELAKLAVGTHEITFHVAGQEVAFPIRILANP